MKINSKGVPHLNIGRCLQSLQNRLADYGRFAWLETTFKQSNKSSMIFRLKVLLVWYECLKSGYVIQTGSQYYLRISADLNTVVKEMDNNMVRIRQNQKPALYSDSFERACYALQIIGVAIDAGKDTLINQQRYVQVNIPPLLSSCDNICKIQSFCEYRECIDTFPNLKKLKVPDVARMVRIHINDKEILPNIERHTTIEENLDDDHSQDSESLASEPGLLDLDLVNDLFEEPRVELSEVNRLVSEHNATFSTLSSLDRSKIILDILSVVMPSSVVV